MCQEFNATSNILLISIDPKDNKGLPYQVSFREQTVNRIIFATTACIFNLLYYSFTLNIAPTFTIHKGHFQIPEIKHKKIQIFEYVSCIKVTFLHYLKM